MKFSLIISSLHCQEWGDDGKLGRGKWWKAGWGEVIEGWEGDRSDGSWVGGKLRGGMMERWVGEVMEADRNPGGEAMEADRKLSGGWWKLTESWVREAMETDRKLGGKNNRSWQKAGILAAQYMDADMHTYLHAYIPTHTYSPDGAAWAWRQILFHLGNVTYLMDVTPSNLLPHPLPPPPISFCVTSIQV